MVRTGAVYHLTTGPIREGARPAAPARTGRRGSKEDLRLAIYGIPSVKYEDHGAIFLSDAQRRTLVHSIAVARDGSVYALANLSRNGRRLTDLIRVRIPMK